MLEGLAAIVFIVLYCANASHRRRTGRHLWEK